MNSNTVARAMKAAASPIRRFASTHSAVPPQLRSAAVKSTGFFKKNWLSDPSTYPLIVIMGCAITFMTGMGLHALTSYKDVQLDPKKRNSMLQTWGEEERPTLLSKVISWNAYGKEGLGIDHEKWQKEKKSHE